MLEGKFIKMGVQHPRNLGIGDSGECEVVVEVIGIVAKGMI